MLLSEQVRTVAKEEYLVNDTTQYESTHENIHNWQNRVTKQITLSEAKLIYVKWNSIISNGQGATRALIGSTPLASSGYQTGYANLDREAFAFLAAGTYTIAFQSTYWKGGTGGYVAVKNIIIGAFVFSDLDSRTYDSGDVSAPASQTTTVLNQNFTTPSARKLAVGTINKYTVLIYVYLTNTTDRSDSPKNAGESDDATKLNWKLFWGASQASWTDRANDWGAITDNNGYGIGAYARYSAALNPATQYNLVIKVSNTIAASRTVRVYATVIICPWIIPYSEYIPVNMDFPQGSTMYVVLEPLNLNPTMNLKLGRVRGVSFGDSTDFYSTSSGTGIQSWSYTFETVEVSNCLLNISGEGGCISILAVDVR